MSKKELQQNTQHTPLSSVVLERIEQITPEARWKFACMNCMVWIAWAVSVVIGAVSVAVLVYVGGHARYALYEATHNTPISFLVEVLPYLWIATFIIMGTFAYINMRHTKSGYKYPMWQLLGSSVVFSILGGLVLYVFGAGYIIDTQLGKSMSMYTSFERAEERMWQKPQEGRLLGAFTTMDERDELYIFEDKNNVQWSIQTIELRDTDRVLLSSGKTVRVLGTTTDLKNKQFHACGVFPWLYDSDISTKDMRKDRESFVKKMYEQMEKKVRLENIEREVFKEDHISPFGDGLCADLVVMKRMKF